jgi:hypothetical protein
VASIGAAMEWRGISRKLWIFVLISTFRADYFLAAAEPEDFDLLASRGHRSHRG